MLLSGDMLYCLQDAEGCYYLGICYETGVGVEMSDDNKAAEYYQRAAELGHPDAQYNLAVFYEDGYGKTCCILLFTQNIYDNIIQTQTAQCLV